MAVAGLLYLMGSSAVLLAAGALGGAGIAFTLALVLALGGFVAVDVTRRQVRDAVFSRNVDILTQRQEDISTRLDHTGTTIDQIQALTSSLARSLEDMAQDTTDARPGPAEILKAIRSNIDDIETGRNIEANKAPHATRGTGSSNNNEKAGNTRTPQTPPVDYADLTGPGNTDGGAAPKGPLTRKVKTSPANTAPSWLPGAGDENLDSAQTLDKPPFSRTVMGELLRTALARQDLQIFAQPVVRLPSRRIEMIELYARLRARPGVYIPATHFINLAISQDLIRDLDRLILKKCLEKVRTETRRGYALVPHIINISHESLRDDVFINSLMAGVRQNPGMAKNLVFEMPQRSYEQASNRHIRLFDALSRLGCRFSMDHLVNPKLNLQKLRQWRISSIRLDSGRLYHMSRSGEGMAVIQRFRDKLEGAGINLVIERVESEDQLRELLDLEINYGQGHLFGKPDHTARYRQPKAA